jgi:hypothetical protein
MVTSSRIGIERINGQIDSIYCASNGNIEGVGYLLHSGYSQIEIVEDLIQIGGFYSLQETPKLCKQEAFHVYRSKERMPYKQEENIQEFMKSNQKNDIDYIYIFSESKSEWFVADRWMFNTNSVEPLRGALIRRGIVVDINPSYNMEEQQSIAQYPLKLYSKYKDDFEDIYSVNTLIYRMREKVIYFSKEEGFKNLEAMFYKQFEDRVQLYDYFLLLKGRLDSYRFDYLEVQLKDHCQDMIRKNPNKVYTLTQDFYEKYYPKYETIEEVQTLVIEMCVALDVEDIHDAFHNLEKIFVNHQIHDLEVIQDSIELLRGKVDGKTFQDIGNMFIQKQEEQTQNIEMSSIHKQL